MSDEKKYFSLISQTPIRRGVHDKIIKSENFSELLTSMELLKKVQDDAEEFRQQVVKECETLKDAAEKKGFEEGYEAWVQQIKYLEQEIQKVREETTKLIMPVALQAAKKICATELSTRPEIILDIVKSTLKAVAQHRRVVLYVNKYDFDIIEQNKGEIKKLFEQLESLSIRDRNDIERGGCVVETEGGIINAQLKDRWISIEAAFTALAAKLIPTEG